VGGDVPFLASRRVTEEGYLAVTALAARRRPLAHARWLRYGAAGALRGSGGDVVVEVEDVVRVVSPLDLP
jgi:hypothetical protein